MGDWHLNKSVPIGMLVALFLQGGTALYKVGQITADIEMNTKYMTRLEISLNVLDTRNRSQALTLARMEETLRNIQRSINRDVGGR